MDIFKKSPMRLHEVIIGWLAIKHTSGTVVKYEHVYRGIVFNHGKLAWQIIIRNIKLCFAFPAIKKKRMSSIYVLYFVFSFPHSKKTTSTFHSPPWAVISKHNRVTDKNILFKAFLEA